MNSGKEKWGKLIDLPEEYSENLDISLKAIHEIQSKKKGKRIKFFLRKWKYVISFATVCVLALCIGIPIYNSFNDSPQIIYYETDEIIYETVADPTVFITEEKLNINYFTSPMVKTQCAIISSTGEFAFLTQEMLYIDETGFDKVDLKIVLKENSKFDFYERFDSLEESVNIHNILIQYGKSVSNGENEKVFFATFNFEKIDYYLEITTEGSEVERLKLYINMLIG